MEEKKESNLKELTMEEKWNLLTIIYLSDIRQLRLISINSINLNFLYPASSLDISIDKEISPLILACYIGKLEIISYLLTNEYININLQSEPEKYSPLIISCYKGYYEIVRILLEMKADINLPNKIGQLPFIFCFSRLEQKSFKYENKKICFMLVELLLAYGADINTNFGDKKLNSIIIKLVSGEINNEEKCRTTCDMIKFLMEKGADVKYKNKEKQNAFMILKNNNKITPKYKQEIYSVLNRNIEKNVLNNDENNNNYLLTLYSSKHGRYNSSINYRPDMLDSQNHLKELRNNLFKTNKDEMILQTIDDNSSSCCIIF